MVFNKTPQKEEGITLRGSNTNSPSTIRKDFFKAYRKRRKPLIVGICWRSTSGKSSISKRLEKEYPLDVLWISADDFFKVLEIIKATNACGPECPPSVDWKKLITAVKLLKKNKPASLPGRGWVNVAERIIEPKPIILVEGHLIFTNNELVKLFDKKIFVEVSDLHILHRRILREGLFLNLNYVMESVIPFSKKFRDKQKANADIFIDGNNTQEHLYQEFLSVLKPRKVRKKKTK